MKRLGLAVGYIGLIALFVLLLTPAHAALINVDFGSDVYGMPSNTYGGAAGQVGAWNNISVLGTTAGLLDINGSATGVSVSLTGGGFGFGGGECGNDGGDGSLFCDMLYRPFGYWDVTFTGLTDGAYDIYYYAPVHPMNTGNISINGTGVTYLLGNSAAQIQGTTWDVLSGVNVVNGILNLQSGANFFTRWNGIAGVQIVQAPVPEPTTLALLSLGLVGFGYSRRKAS